jgi:hypothetical protein
MRFEVLGQISAPEMFATGRDPRNRSIKESVWARAMAQTEGNSSCSAGRRLAEVHWYEAAGIGRKELKIKHLFEV